MDQWRLVDVGMLPSLDTQTVYHAVALARSEGIVPDTLILCYPENPFICIGYHQVINLEVDVDFCNSRGIPIVRRCLGGGTVLLDKNQLFYQVIVGRDNPKIPLGVRGLFETLLRPVVYAFQNFGIPAEYKPINDIEVDGKKISGNGAGLVEKANVLTGNMIFDFDYDTMVSCFKIPSEKFKDKLATSLRERVTTIKRELGDKTPSREVAKKTLISCFEKFLDIQLVYSELTRKEGELIKELNEQYNSDEWLFMHEHRKPNLASPTRTLKISARSRIVETTFKAPGGLIRATLEIDDKNKIVDVLISGDFWVYPKETLKELENTLIGCNIDEKEILNAIYHFYKATNVKTPGMLPEHFAKTILSTKNAKT